MNAIIYSKKAQPNQLILSKVSKPETKESEVLVRVHTSSLNAADYRSMKMGVIPKSKIFGADIAGVVEAIGASVTNFKVGEEVIGDLSNDGFGGFAEYVAAPEKTLIKKPQGIKFEEAAAFPLAGSTALQALRNAGKIKKGQHVLIVGSAGGVGTFAVQLAVHFGAIVTGVCSTLNMQQTLDLGAQHVIDYTTEDFTKQNKRYDLILAINGNYPLLAYLKALNKKGRIVTVGGSLPQIFKSLLFGWLVSFGSKKVSSLSAKSSPTELTFLATLFENGSIKSVIDSRYSLEETADAMKYVAQGHSKGKVVIEIVPSTT